MHGDEPVALGLLVAAGMMRRLERELDLEDGRLDALGVVPALT